MSTNQDKMELEEDRETTERQYALPQGYSWYGIPSAHSHTGRHLQKKEFTEITKVNWLYSRGIFVVIVSVVFLIFIIIDQGINEQTIFYFGFWTILLIFAGIITVWAHRERKLTKNGPN